MLHQVLSKPLLLVFRLVNLGEVDSEVELLEFVFLSKLDAVQLAWVVPPLLSLGHQVLSFENCSFFVIYASLESFNVLVARIAIRDQRLRAVAFVPTVPIIFGVHCHVLKLNLGKG